MNPNQPDPNNPNQTGNPLPDLTSSPSQPDLNSSLNPAEPAPTTPLPDTNAPVASSQAAPPAPQEPQPQFSSGTTYAPSAPIPTFTPPEPVVSGPPPESPTPTDPSGFSWQGTPNSSQMPETQTTPPDLPVNQQYASSFGTPTVSAEPAPSDLSHLVNPTQEPPQPYTPASQPETLVPSNSNGNTEVPNLPTEGNQSGIPKWVIGVGVVLLLVVLAASAYFILGVGKEAPSPESIPATTQTEQIPAVQTQPIPTIAAPQATSAGFESLPGGSGTQATSAADLLRQRQGQ